MALSVINGIEGDVGVHVFLTRANFQSILSQIHRPQEWTLLMDEVVDAVEFSSIPLGKDPESSQAMLGELYEKREDGELVASQLAEDIVSGKALAHQYKGSLGLAKCLVNPGVRVEQLGEPRRGKGRNLWCTYAYIPKPDYYASFSCVMFASALLNQTLFYRLWGERYDVRFNEIEAPEFNDLHDTHAHQGPLLTFYWLFADGEIASRGNLERSRETYRSGGRSGAQVIDACVEAVDGFFGGAYALQVNNGWDGVWPRRAVRVPVRAEGLNTYQALTDVALLAVTNPDQTRETWVRDKLDVGRDEANGIFRLHTLYQGLGRIALRVRGNDKPLRAVVLSKADAEYLTELFDGSTLGGKVGEILPFPHGDVGRPPTGKALKDNPEYQRLVKERNKLRLRVKRAKTEEKRVQAKKELQKVVDAIEAMKGL